MNFRDSAGFARTGIMEKQTLRKLDSCELDARFIVMGIFFFFLLRGVYTTGFAVVDLNTGVDDV